MPRLATASIVTLAIIFILLWPSEQGGSTFEARHAMEALQYAKRSRLQMGQLRFFPPTDSDPETGRVKIQYKTTQTCHVECVVATAASQLSSNQTRATTSVRDLPSFPPTPAISVMLRAPLRSSASFRGAIHPLRQRPVSAAAKSAASSSGKRIFCSATKEASKSSEIPLQVGLASGGIAGVVSALTGVGGGLILIPTLAKFTTLTQQAVNGTSIGAVTLSASVGAWNYFESGACNYPLAFVTTIPAIICTRYGVQTAHRLSSKRLSLVVGTAMLACSPLIFLKNSPYFPKWNTDHDPLDLQFYGQPLKEDQVVPYDERIQRDVPGFAAANAKYLVAGAFAGFISGLCGLGGGILMTAYLTAASDMPQAHIIGTSLLSIVPTAASSTYFNIKAKSIHIPTAVRVGGSLAVGVYLTSKYVTHDVPEDVLRGILGTTLSAAAIVMMRRAL